MSTVKATRACNFIQLRSKAEAFLKQMSAMGVTTVEGKSGYGLDKETELLQLRVMRSLNNDEHKRVSVHMLCLQNTTDRRTSTWTTLSAK